MSNGRPPRAARKSRQSSDGSPSPTTGVGRPPTLEERDRPFAGDLREEKKPTSIRAPWADAAPALGRGRDPFRVPPDKVTLHTDPDLLPEQPKESEGLFELVGTVARRALGLGLATREPSFHVFVAAEQEVMIEDDIVRYAHKFAQGRPAPPDIVYVHDFAHPEAPRPLLLPAGMGPMLVEAMQTLIDKLQEEITTIANSDEMRRSQSELAQQVEAKNRAVITDLETTAKTLGFGIRTIQGGVQTFPILHGKPVSAEQFAVLDESTKRALAEAEERLTHEVEKAATLVRKQSARFDAARNDAYKRAAEEVIVEAMRQLTEAFSEAGEDVRDYFETVQAALVDDWADLLPSNQEADQDAESRDIDPEHATSLGRFMVNLFVTHDPEAPPPIIYETNPTYANLFGYLERRARFGALLTDFTRVRAGSLHRASGGVLVVRAADLLTDPIIWERMKRVLRERQVGAEDPLGPLGVYATSLRPVPVPIRVRVVLVGSPELYAMLLDADADFASLFRVKVEIDPSIPRSKDSLVTLDAYLMAMAQERGWGFFDRAARARLLDLATRLAGDRDRLALCLSPLEETAAFASALSSTRATVARLEAELSRPHTEEEEEEAAASIPPPTFLVTASDIDQAWRERRDRAGSAERHIRELTVRGEVALDTTGTRVGVVNGLSVFSAGDVEFGQPMRITAVIALGREGIVDVEREAQLGGSIHTKGVAILRGYLGKMFGQERPLSIRAQIAFEQSYGEIDGDSASSAELFAVMSALADVGIDQSIAVTGSVNQLGEIQAIGGACAKIEGFFDLCAARGLTGTQGVLMPRSNLPHLVLREDVTRAIAEGKFHIYVLDSVAQGIEILTGLPAGERDASGRFPASSVFGRVERRIIEIAERLREAEGHAQPAPLESLDDLSSPDLGEDRDF